MKRTAGDGKIIQVPRWLTGTGQIVRTHSLGDCDGGACVVHNPSDHHMRDFPTHWREDRGITERICPHGVGHPDIDEINPDDVHGCCPGRCCVPLKPEAA